MQYQRQEGIVEDLKVHSGLVGLVVMAKGKRKKKKWMMIMMNVFHNIFIYFYI
jgi:predicted nucleic acid-binding Zn ribbon protein